MKNVLKVVVAGEVDAGKSTLIGRLLYDTGSLHKAALAEIFQASRLNGNILEFAYLLDGLEEERRGQLTIDTTQAFCRNAKSGFWFIDVPGHAELLKNMLCGSSCSQVAILVTDATKSLTDGTIRHINVLKFLGIEQIVVVLNKLDILDFSKDGFERAKGEISAFFKLIGIKTEYFIPVSARQGDNLAKKSTQIPWYKGPCLISALCSLKGKNKTDKKSRFYFPIQDVYVRKEEPVFVGTILSGQIRKNDAIYVSPEGRVDKIKAIRVLGKDKISAKAPESIGLELVRGDRLSRGQIISNDGKLSASAEITAKILCVQPINPGEKLFFSCTMQQTICSIKQINKFSPISAVAISDSKVSLDKEDVAEVLITCKEPVVVKKFLQVEALGRFVLKNDREIIAVGIIT
ncbi:MAG: 50S ribosome-binding GTPase [Candidatus Omnitrophica bacterium]|nr:50S ribosome-binding GTPase [Candidatus Omnitrophota bacterium]MBU1923328.1 50S ribosome-binding GTPase [Candidatus Omnitrophota bacterium]